jgi:hypothetical protein
MQNLGKITNHHLAITDFEQLATINALAFFHAVFDPNRSEAVLDIVAEWQDVANDTNLNLVDTLATRVARL